MKIYLAGPMTGIPDYNRAAFDAAAKFLRDRCHLVYNPAETPPSDYNENPRAAWLENLDFICAHADRIVYLPGSDQSKGAQIEMALAKYHGIPCIAFAGIKTSDI